MHRADCILNAAGSVFWLKSTIYRAVDLRGQMVCYYEIKANRPQRSNDTDVAGTGQSTSEVKCC